MHWLLFSELFASNFPKRTNQCELSRKISGIKRKVFGWNWWNQLPFSDYLKLNEDSTLTTFVSASAKLSKCYAPLTTFPFFIGFFFSCIFGGLGLKLLPVDCPILSACMAIYSVQNRWTMWIGVYMIPAKRTEEGIKRKHSKIRRGKCRSFYQFGQFVDCLKVFWPRVSPSQRWNHILLRNFVRWYINLFVISLERCYICNFYLINN